MRYYGMIRLGVFFGIVFLPLLILMIKKMRISGLRNALVIILFFLVGIASFVSRLFPVENHFISFSSPSSVLAYYVGSIEEIIDVVEGESSCLVLYCPPHTSVSYANMRNGNYSPRYWYSHDIMQKTFEGYKIPDIYTTKITRYKLDEDGEYSIYHVKNTDDYYLFGFTDLVENEFDYVYGYGNSYTELQVNLKRVHVTINENGSPQWKFSL